MPITGPPLLLMLFQNKSTVEELKIRPDNLRYALEMCVPVCCRKIERGGGEATRKEVEPPRA